MLAQSVWKWGRRRVKTITRSAWPLMVARCYILMTYLNFFLGEGNALYQLETHILVRFIVLLVVFFQNGLVMGPKCVQKKKKKPCQLVMPFSVL